jgi:GPH family glycoside/pentoside/hexuronide:cation symporter
MSKPNWQLTTLQRSTYSVGMFSTAIVTATVMQWLFYYYSPPPNEVDKGMVFLGLGLAVGMARLIGAAVDALSNPLVAFWSDKSRDPRGRRIPFIVRGAIPLMLLAILVWFPPVRGVSIWNVVWLACTLAGTWFFYTYVVAPYLALMPEITTDPEERVSLTVTMSYWEAGATAIAALAVPPVIEAFKGGVQLGPVFIADGFKLTAIALAIIGGIGFFVSVSKVREKRLADSKVTDFSLSRSVLECFKNPAFPPYLLAVAVAKVAVGLMIISLPFFATAVLHKGEGFTAALFAPLFLSTIIGFVVGEKIVNRHGLKKAFRAATLAGVGIFLGFFVVYFAGGRPQPLTAFERAADGGVALSFGDNHVTLKAEEWKGLFQEEGQPKRRFDDGLAFLAPRLVADPVPGQPVRLEMGFAGVREPDETRNLDGWHTVFSTAEERAAMDPVAALQMVGEERVLLHGSLVFADGSMVFQGFSPVERADADAAVARLLKTGLPMDGLRETLSDTARLDNVLARFDLRVEQSLSVRIYLALLVCFLLGFPASILMSMYRPIVCEIIDEDERRVGYRREAMYFGVEGLLTKFSDGIAGMVVPIVIVVGHLLAAPPFGYVLSFAVGSVFMLLAWWIFRWYPLGQRAVSRSDGEPG